MDQELLKMKLQTLWKQFFSNNDDEYLSLLFQDYIDFDYVEVDFEGDNLTSSVIGIPYKFGNQDYNIRGLYLLPLASISEKRKYSILSKLINRLHEKALVNGFAFTFIIPTDKSLTEFYKNCGYVNGFYRVIDNYTTLHDFDAEYFSLLSDAKPKVAELKRGLYSSLKVSSLESENLLDLNGAIALIKNEEAFQNDLRVIHSDKDLELILKKNRLIKDSIFIVKNSAGEITGCALVSSGDKSCIQIQKIYYADLASKFKLMSHIKFFWPNASLQVYVSTVDMTRKALWTRTYGSVMTDSAEVGTISMAERVYSLAAHSKMYGMVRIGSVSEILEFMAKTRRDLKYSILVHDDRSDKVKKITISKGTIKIEEIEPNHLSMAKHLEIMNEREVAEIVFRRRDGDNLITEAFGIPSINASVSLLLEG